MSEALKQLLMMVVVIAGGMKPAIPQASSSSPGVRKIAHHSPAIGELRTNAVLWAGLEERRKRHATTVYKDTFIPGVQRIGVLFR